MLAVLEDPIRWDEDTEFESDASYIRPGLPRQTLRRLRRGDWHTQAELDLHGLTKIEAKHELVEFLHECKRRGVRCIRIIHGKGLRSKNREPVLKQHVRHWLMQRDEVLAFVQARPVDGGSGAVMVLLKSAFR
jgi:DNA-nicking Smr family endonuclease